MQYQWRLPSERVTNILFLRRLQACSTLSKDRQIRLIPPGSSNWTELDHYQLTAIDRQDIAYLLREIPIRRLCRVGNLPKTRYGRVTLDALLSAHLIGCLTILDESKDER